MEKRERYLPKNSDQLTQEAPAEFHRIVRELLCVENSLKDVPNTKRGGYDPVLNLNPDQRQAIREKLLYTLGLEEMYYLIQAADEQCKIAFTKEEHYDSWLNRFIRLIMKVSYSVRSKAIRLSRLDEMNRQETAIRTTPQVLSQISFLLLETKCLMEYEFGTIHPEFHVGGSER